MELREPLLGVAVGSKGVGKTYTTKELIEQYVYQQRRKVLILDINDEYTGYRAIGLEHILLWSAIPRAEVRRIRPFHPNNTKMTLKEYAQVLFLVLGEFAGGLLLIEDINKYVSDSMPSDLIGAICTNRHTDTDIIMHYQSIGRITPKVWQNINWLRFHKNTDAVYRHVGKFEDKIDVLTITENLVNHEYWEKNNKRFFLYVDFDTMKITGQYDLPMFEQAVKEFLQSKYGKDELKKLREETDDRGRRKYNSEEVIKVATSKLIRMYGQKSIQAVA